MDYIDFDKPLTNKNGKPLTILMAGCHWCIRVHKRAKALRKVGYTTIGLGEMNSYGTNELDMFALFKGEKQFKNSLRTFISQGIDIIDYSNEPDFPVIWARNVVTDMGSNVPIIADLHDLDSIRRQFIPLDEQKMFNAADGLIYASQPIQKITNELHKVNIPNVVIYSYCSSNKQYDYDRNDIFKRRGLVYEGGANPPDDEELSEMYAYRNLYGIIKKLVEMGNETAMYCGNLSAFDTYHGTGAVLFPPTHYDEMMKALKQYKYGLCIWNNQSGKNQQVDLTLSNKMMEYAQAGLPSLACWCKETEKYINKHNIGFTFTNLEEIGNCTQLESKYLEIMDNLDKKRKELVMENFICRVENLYAKVLDLPVRKSMPEDIKKLHVFEYGEEDILDNIA